MCSLKCELSHLYAVQGGKRIVVIELFKIWHIWSRSVRDAIYPNPKWNSICQELSDEGGFIFNMRTPAIR